MLQTSYLAKVISNFSFLLFRGKTSMMEEERRPPPVNHPPLTRHSSTIPIGMVGRSGSYKDQMKPIEGKIHNGHPRNSALRIREGFRPLVQQNIIVEGK